MPSADPSPEAIPEIAPNGCPMGTRINFVQQKGGNAMVGTLIGELTDRGATDAASGSPALNASGDVVSYTVISGDSMIGVGDRFCIDFVTIAQYNHIYPFEDVHPGDELILRPDPTVA